MGFEHKSTNINFREFFSQTKTIAVVGYSDKTERAGNFVAHYLIEQGYEVVGVNPKLAPESGGISVYATLADIPVETHIDVIDVFRAPSAVPAIAMEAAKMSPVPRYFFMQPGAQSDEAAAIAIKAGMTPIMNACIMAEHKAL